MFSAVGGADYGIMASVSRRQYLRSKNLAGFGFLDCVQASGVWPMLVKLQTISEAQMNGFEYKKGDALWFRGVVLSVPADRLRL